MTVQEIAQTAFNMAIDQQDDYDSIASAFEAYSTNAGDTAEEQGLDPSDCYLIFENIARKEGYGNQVDAMWRI